MIDFINNELKWSSFSPTKIYFGVGQLDEIGNIIKPISNRVMIVASKSAVKNNILSRCTKQLTSNDIQSFHLSSVNANPTIHEVNDIVDLVRQKKVNCIIAIGGGSVMDAAKAASAVITTGKKINQLFTEQIELDNIIHLVAIPTTAGTGSELSKGAIINWPEKKIKGGVRGKALIPSIAIVDPSLTLSLSERNLKITSFDAFTHAVETFISEKSNLMTSHFSLLAIEGVVQNLLRAIKDKTDITPRINLSFFSMLMGYNLANSSTCLPHRLQYPLGSLTNTPHALGLAALYPEWIRITSPMSKNKFTLVKDSILKGLGLNLDNQMNINDVVHSFMKKINLQPSLTNFDLDEYACKEMATMVKGNLSDDPWWKDGNNLEQFYINSL